jgi:hypothetical protein
MINAKDGKTGPRQHLRDVTRIQVMNICPTRLGSTKQPFGQRARFAVVVEYEQSSLGRSLSQGQQHSLSEHGFGVQKEPEGRNKVKTLTG